MKLFIRNSILILLFFSASSEAREIEVAAGWDKPPYIMSRGHTGFELELIRAILKELGHEMVPVYVPMGRVPKMVREESVDIGLTMNHRHNIDRTTLSKAYVAYQNVAVTLADRNVALKRMSDLKNYTVIGFQTAKRVLGNEYSDAVEGHSGYLETPQQSRQVSMLLFGSVDVAVMDRNIFNYFKNQLPSHQQFPTKMFEIFPVIFYHAAILDPKLRAGFDRVLAEMMSDGRYQALTRQFYVADLLERAEQPGEQSVDSGNAGAEDNAN
ncbi:transporter substrate-binding domain-containing protein [Alteromonas ponticola]|uniref:Transporter substrate-binding domain-containing protein n=1 Tax=Alteromonas aquimaris TaxID=2998417 RepID=A0ABT3PAG6_9ALTE|nr:transporter substrate-binding domain-containing protein [Alteromonas aquimaris]MCW8109066.1 transporter substrate-binding domain-containing protein [Alteromonas aquimaris]